MPACGFVVPNLTITTPHNRSSDPAKQRVKPTITQWRNLQVHQRSIRASSNVRNTVLPVELTRPSVALLSVAPSFELGHTRTFSIELIQRDMEKSAAKARVPHDGATLKQLFIDSIYRSAVPVTLPVPFGCFEVRRLPLEPRLHCMTRQFGVALHTGKMELLSSKILYATSNEVMCAVWQAACAIAKWFGLS